ncbi:Enolase-phosphatase E1 isoform X2 [Oopsacas minuta]|uniref:Enolase-phosphatase E1 isoform X2 n=1 Tax=Oopsacas minuta TaxID=111878 RepID=A0AAV7JZ71_9METZ|nr:Enolase-phosphatase E1 isoform X2 [Oopsacas minuta]
MSTDRITEQSNLFDSDDDGGEDIFNTTESPRKVTKKVVTQENDPFLNILDSETTNLSPYLTPSTQSPGGVDISDDLGSQNIADSSEDFEKQLVAEKARSATYNALNNELYEKLETVELELEQTKFDYAKSQEKLSSKLEEESQWNLQKEALKSQLRISQDENQKLKTENQELGVQSQMENDTTSDQVAVLRSELNNALTDKENAIKNLQKVETTLSNLSKENKNQDNYISDLKSQLAEKNETIAQLEQQKVSAAREDISDKDMSSTIKNLEKSIALKDQKISELEDLAIIARRSKRQEQEMKLQDEKIITLERRVEFLQNQDRLRTKSPTEDQISNPQVELVPQPIEPVEKQIEQLVKPVLEVAEPVLQQTQASHTKKSAPVPGTPKISIDTSAHVNSALPPRETQNKTAVIVDRQTGKSLRTATLEERMKKFRGSAENIASDESSATKHTFRRVSSSGSARSTPSPDILRATSLPVSPDIGETEIKIDPPQSLPPRDPSDANKVVKSPLKKTYSPLLSRANRADVDPDICISCGRRAYPIEKITVDKMPYHKFCFKCIICKSILRPGKHASYEGTIYCLNHFKQEFLGGGGKYPGQIRHY